MSPARRPLISVCIPTYKGAATIGSTIESVLAQSMGDFELIVVDDRSPDTTADVIRRFSDPRIRLVVNERNLGPVGNWNRCLELAAGTYYKLLPHDDLLSPACLEEQVGVLAQPGNETIALAFGWRWVISPSGRRMFRRGRTRGPHGRQAAARLMRACVRAGTNVIGEPGAGLMRTELARKLGGYTDRHAYLIDLDFWFRALQHGDAFHTGTWSSSFRLSKGSWSVAIGQRQFADFREFVDRSDAYRSGTVTHIDRTIGLLRARAGMTLRRLVYQVAP